MRTGGSNRATATGTSLNKCLSTETTKVLSDVQSSAPGLNLSCLTHYTDEIAEGGTFLSMATAEFISYLWSPCLPQKDLNEKSIFSVGRDHDLFDV